MKKKTKKKIAKNESKTRSLKTIKTLVKAYSNETGIKPLGSRVLIKPYTKEELAPKNTFGIILPEAGSKDKSEQGIVLAIGSGEYQDGKLVPVRVRVGDKVAFSKYGFEDIVVGGEELYLIKEENILAVLK